MHPCSPKKLKIFRLNPLLKSIDIRFTGGLGSWKKSILKVNLCGEIFAEHETLKSKLKYLYEYFKLIKVLI